jgi:hypothetical protein
MNPARFAKVLRGGRFRRELNRSLWLEPFTNRGVFDAGWSCRDHAWVCSLLACANGFEAVVVHGKLVIVAQSSRTGQRVGYQVLTHSWSAIAAVGFCDLSLKTDFVLPDGDGTLPLGPVVQNNILPQAYGDTYFADNESDGHRAVTESIGYGKRVTLVYSGKEYDTLLEEYVTRAVDLINSPLTDQLRVQFDSSIYAKLVLHLDGLIHGSRHPIVARTRDEFWKALATSFDNANEQLLDLTRLRGRRSRGPGPTFREQRPEAD